jgi:FkbM family methyltransferase
MSFSRVKHSILQNRAAKALFHPALLIRRALAQRGIAARHRLVRTLQERLAEDPVVEVKEFQGTFLLDRRSHLFARVASEGAYEPELAAVCAANLDPTRDAIDVGANVGFYTNLMARQLRGRRVLAIEPTPNALSRLKHNLERNGVAERTIVFEGIAADREGVRRLNIVVGKEEYSSVGALAHPSIHEERSETREVQASTIDALVQRHGLDPGFIKIDVEGAEYEVLRGAEATLKKHRPIVLSELSAALLQSNGSSAAAVIEFMRRLAYRIVDPLHPGRRFVARDYGDMLCLPDAAD